MRLFLLASIVLSGCCSISGQRDSFYTRSGTDVLILCSDSTPTGGTGFFAMVPTGQLEGKRFETYDTTTTVATNKAYIGDTGAFAFDLLANGDGTLTTPQLGDPAWTTMSVNDTERTHGHVHCTDLEMRAWWSTLAAPM
jgi:hypothetical protein